jgi:hypothetical protein
MKSHIGKTYIVTKINNWFDLKQVLKIHDHRLRRTYTSVFQIETRKDKSIYSELGVNKTSDARRDQTNYEYEFLVETIPDFLVNYFAIPETIIFDFCKELKDDK